MRFSNHTIYDKKRLIRFSDFVALRKRFFWIFIVVCNALILVAFAFNIAFKSYDSVIPSCFTLTIVIDLICVFCSFIFPRITVKRSPALNADILFEFQEDSFKVSAKTKNSTDFSELNYPALVKVMESEQDIYLYLSARQAYVLDKSGFNSGSPDEFVEFLKDKNIPYKR